MARRIGSRAFWFASALVLLAGTTWLIVALVRLDPNNPDSGEAAGFIALILGGGTLAITFVLAGCGLLFAHDGKSVSLYFAALGILSFALGMTFFRGTGWSIALLLLAVGSSYLFWRRASGLLLQQVALAGLLVVGSTAVFRVVPLPVGILVLLSTAFMLLNVKRLNRGLRHSTR